jgi:tRNA threonylcarbamoyladenosine biosynthesis protein TsaE
MSQDPRTFDLANEAATQEFGAWLGRHARPGDTICLFGTLGAGKSTLARSFIRALTNPEEDVPSPTFTLVQTYESSVGSIWHFDLYRLEQPEDVYELGLDDALHDICLIEWPERMGSLLPKKRLEVMLEISPNPIGRKCTLRPTGHWVDDLELLQ